MVVKTVVEAQDIFDKAWEGFKGVDWKEKASISRFVQANYTPYDEMKVSLLDQQNVHSTSKKS